MIEAARQRADVPKTRSSSAWLPVAVLAALAASAQAQQQATNSASQAQAQAAPPTPSGGVSAQAATEAAAQAGPAQDATAQGPAAQDPAAQDTSKGAQAVQPASGTVAPGVDAALAPVPVPVLAGSVRGVLFRITPPSMALLPAEVMQQAPPGDGEATAIPVQASEATPATTAVLPPPVPPRASYLLATIHFGTPEEQGLDYAVLERALAEVETFVNEADLDSPWQAGFDGYRWLPPEQPLSKMISKDSFAMARSLLPKLRAQDLERTKPWSVLALLEARGETGGEATMDARLQRAAMAAGKRMAHLESLEQQLQALDCVPASEHSLVLDERLRASWILRVASARAMAWYRARNLEGWLADIDRMDGLSNEAKAIEQRSRRCLLEQRNARWIDQLQTLFQDGPCLVAVGAAHLVGPDGLIVALRREGYRVEAEPL